MRFFGLEITRRKRSAALAASYDAAQTNVDNRQHWAATDALSPNAAASLQARKVLRERARYEVTNNSFAKGIVLTVANDTIGTGPRLQMLRKSNKQIEQDWRQWCCDTRFCSKLRTMRVAKLVDGEAIGRYVNNRALPLVTLDIRLHEADEMSDPWYSDFTNQMAFEYVDGLKLDENGNPIAYHILDQHPGGQYLGFSGSSWDGKWYDRSQVIHLYREDRPGQRRGVPELTPALPLFAMLRRYSLSTLAAAETAADFAAVLKTDSPSFTPDDIQNVDPGVSFPIRRRTIMSLPFGWEIQQLKAEQPATGFKEYRDAVLNEIARCLNVPFNVAAGNSSGYNYSSGRLDHQVYHRAIDIERSETVERVVDPTFVRWLREYLSIKSGIRQSDIDLSQYLHRWYWDPKPHVDPEKEANAKIALWDKGLMTDDEFLMEEGIDPESHYEKLAEMIERRKSLGLPIPGVATQQINTDDPQQKDPDDVDELAEEEEIEETTNA